MLRILTVGYAAYLLSTSSPAHAWAIGSQLNNTGCHEPITAQALRNVRATRTTAPALTPTRDEAALIDDVLWSAPADFIPDLAGMALLLGVRDNDLKGINPLSSLDLVQVHGNPTTQEEHCIRAGGDDGAAGDQSAIDACRAFIHDRVAAALEGLDASGNVDAAARKPFTVYVGLAGRQQPPLPVFYIEVGAAMHAFEDSFTHMYRAADGLNVTVVTNWIDLVDGVGYDEARDGPGHRAQLDHCWHNDPLIQRNYQNAITAVTELLDTALDPALSRNQKLAKVDAVTLKWLTYKPGCTFENQWCDAPEAKVVDTSATGCAVGGGGTTWGALLLVGLVVLRRRRAVVALALVAGMAIAHADPKPTAPAVPAAPAEPSAPAVPVTPPAAPVDPAAPAVVDAPAQKEPGRDIKTPTVAEVQAVRKDKELGSALGFAVAMGASLVRGGGDVEIAARYRITERWIVGLDAGWNPWVTTSPLKARAGVATLAASLIRRWPMKFDRVNLRTSGHLGVSTLLFDVYGAPKYSTGPYFAISPLGIDYDLGGSVRLVVDPVEFAMPIPLVGQLPLYYEQFRFMIGLQIGA